MVAPLSSGADADALLRADAPPSAWAGVCQASPIARAIAAKAAQTAAILGRQPFCPPPNKRAAGVAMAAKLSNPANTPYLIIMRAQLYPSSLAALNFGETARAAR